MSPTFEVTLEMNYMTVVEADTKEQAIDFARREAANEVEATVIELTDDEAPTP